MNLISEMHATSHRHGWTGVFLALAICVSGAARAAPTLLKEMPAKGVLRLGEVAYVDDGTCPAGEVKKVTGGNQKAGVARQVECVKRPVGSP